MKKPFIFLSLLFSLHLVTVSLASKVHMVHNGLDIREAYKKAKKLCPEKLIGNKRKQEVQLKIQGLLAPSYETGDPERKTYMASYVPDEVQIHKHLVHFCGIEVDGLPMKNSEKENSENAVQAFDEQSTFINDDFEPESTKSITEKKIDYQYSFLFFFGFVIGVLFVFVYNSRLQSEPVHTSNKSLRRPEL